MYKHDLANAQTKHEQSLSNYRQALEEYRAQPTAIRLSRLKHYGRAIGDSLAALRRVKRYV